MAVREYHYLTAQVMAIKENKSFTRTQIEFARFCREKVMAYVFQRLAVCQTYWIALFSCQRTRKKKIIFPIYRVGKEGKCNQNSKLFPLLVQMERFIFSFFTIICTANVHLLSWNGKILTSFLAPYRDRNCHFAKLMTKKDYFSFHTLTTQTIPLLPTIEWNIFFAPYRERKP